MNAYEFAEVMHCGQEGRGSEPYFDHCRYVASMAVELAAKYGLKSEYLGRIYEAGLLHDVVEDTSATHGDVCERFGSDVADIVKAMTKAEGESRDEYINRVAGHEFAVFVEMADLLHNMELSRIPAPCAKDFDRSARYIRELEFISTKVAKSA